MNIATAKKIATELKKTDKSVRLFKRGEWLWIAGPEEGLEIKGFQWSTHSEAYFAKPNNFGVEISL